MTRGLRSAMLVIACAAGAAAPSSAAAFEPLEGVWRTETSTRGEFLIQARAPGELLRTTIRGREDCQPDERGFRALLGEETRIRGSALDYTLAPVFRDNDTCQAEGVGQGIIRVTSTDPQDYRHVGCSARPGTGPPQYDESYRPTSPNTICRTSVRVRAPRPPVKARDVAVVPRTRCTRRARSRGRRVRVRLANPANEPVRTAVVRVGRRALYRYEYPGRLRGSVVVRLPRRAVRVRVAVRTTSNRSLASGRRYAKCARR